MDSPHPPDQRRHPFFVTFSCYRGRRMLDHDRAKKVVLGVLGSQLSMQDGRCIGFVLMPDHVHAIAWLPDPDGLSHFMKQWKQRSSVNIKRLRHDDLQRYFETIEPSEPIWQAGYHDFTLFNPTKIEEKLNYMHQNPVRAGLVEYARDWPWSSARHYEEGRSVGVPVGWLE